MTALETETAIAERVDNGDGEGQKVFHDSTHQFILYFGHTKDIFGLSVGIATLMLQVFLYSIIVAEGKELFSNDRIPVEVKFGQSCTVQALVAGGSKPFNVTDSAGEVTEMWDNGTDLICEAEEKGNIYAILGFTLLGAFIMGDVITALRGFFNVSGIFSKIGGIVVICVCVYASFAGSLFAFQGVYFGSKYDTIVNCVGVLFINDLDEKIFAAMEQVRFGPKLKEKMSCICCDCCEYAFPCVCVVICFVIFIVIGMMSAEAGSQVFFASLDGEVEAQ